jgi:hypothetical protein
MLKKAIFAAAVGAALLGSVGVSYADYVRPDGTVVRTYPRRVIVAQPYYGDRYYHRGYHRVWHHGRTYWERSHY